jgi:hypothetical protein
MQGLFGRFGQKKADPVIARPNSRPKQSKSRTDSAEIDADEFPIAKRYNADDEDTNWDDAETIENENSPIVFPQSNIPAVATSASTVPEIDNWDEALPAATVKDSSVREVRRKNRVPATPNEDVWDENLPSPTFSIGGNPDLKTVSTDRLGQAVGLWAAIIQQFRRILPQPLRQLSDAIVTVILVALVTISIWLVDSFALPGIDPSTANPPTSPIATIQPSSPIVNPEQAFIDALQTQLADVTSQYPDNIIQTLQVDSNSDRLIVQLNPVWYSIDENRQNNLTDRMWLQAKANHFTRLELQDADGMAIARSPVVGRHMIILQRQKSA